LQPDSFLHGLFNRHGILARFEMEKQDEAGGSFRQGVNGGMVVIADDQIALPMAGYGPDFCFGWTLRDHHHVGNRAGSGPMAPRPTSGSTRAQAPGQLPAELAPALDVERLVNRFVAHLHHRIVRVLEAPSAWRSRQVTKAAQGP
jgi:hypothetical protein